ncbi:unnamed protein product [Bursaphelenchus okinawaensis]|uniref:Hyaluronidase n=1 Tax=Bursaphelenchus okinawaensis TaxID=465554 RepID=A0A811KS05_9BILA|nr:unnamed protein product [Bursaphelenchus okinawaensis]CAG9109732.1 unnamed protein product [Bursaphelenchus okinawaensis]
MLTNLWLLLCFVGTVNGFEVIWNIPSKQCTFNPTSFGLAANSNNKFFGDKVVLLYETFGLFPFCNSEQENDEQKPECVPAADLSAHLEKAAADIEAAIPDPDFNGYGVIDYEAWRPLYEMNWSSRRIYQRYSRKLVQEITGITDPHELDHLARAEFDLAAKQFLVETIKLAKKLRPKAKWGFWEYPLCDYRAGYENLHCLDYYNDFNDQLSYIADHSDAIYPHIYYYEEEASEGQLHHAYARMKQTTDYIAKYNPNATVIPYIKIEYAPDESGIPKFYSKPALCASIKYPMELGAEAVLVWGGSWKMKERCQGFEEYLNSTVKPFVGEVRRKAEKCRESYCNNNGRCATDVNIVPNECHLGHSMVNPHCICYTGFEGKQCENKMTHF